jgi:4-amino-4-deoxy-L-arabinose transferase-like glycosyltransferase
MKRISRLEATVVVLVLLLSLASRLTSLSAFRVADEMRWMCRIIGFRDALARGDWANTYLIGHPGVVTTWLGVISTPSESAEVRAMCHTSLDGRRLERIAGSQEERNQLLVALNQLLIRARVGVAVFSWICIAATYVLARLIWGPRVAVPGLIMVALDPFYLAMSRFLHLDAVLASAMILSVLSLLVSLDRSRSRRWRVAFLVLSAVMGGVSILQKSPAMFLGPFVALVQGANAVREGVRWDRLLRAAGALLIWGLIAVAVYVVLWPAMWVDPVGTMQQVLFTALGYAESGHLPGNYFLGHPVHDPGWLFYPVTLAFRLSPLALPGLVLGVMWAAKERGDTKARFEIGVLLAYGALFGAFMSLGSKKFDRYVLPLFPALDIVATVGLVWAVKSVWERFRLRGLLQSRWVAYGALAAVQIAVMALHYPYYLTYYNPLLGGIRQAEKVLLVGWGEGYEEAAAYLNAKPDAEQLQVTVPTFPVFAPQFRGDTRRVQE